MRFAFFSFDQTNPPRESHDNEVRLHRIEVEVEQELKQTGGGPPVPTSALDAERRNRHAPGLRRQHEIDPERAILTSAFTTSPA